MLVLSLRLQSPSCCLKSFGQDFAFIISANGNLATHPASSGHIWHRERMFGSTVTINRWISFLKTISTSSWLFFFFVVGQRWRAGCENKRPKMVGLLVFTSTVRRYDRSSEKPEVLSVFVQESYEMFMCDLIVANCVLLLKFLQIVWRQKAAFWLCFSAAQLYFWIASNFVLTAFTLKNHMTPCVACCCEVNNPPSSWNHRALSRSSFSILLLIVAY